MLEVQKLYPQYRILQDRRQQSVPVTFDRRSGVDRRAGDRVKLDTNLTKDIFEIKSKVSNMPNIEPKHFSRVNFTRNASNAAQNSLKTDQFVKTTKDSDSSKNVKTKKEASSAALAGGFLACALGGIMAAPLLGPVGIGVAIGITSYFGLRLLNQVISSHLKK